MVPVAQAIIHEDTVMVEFLDTSVAKIAVICIFGSQIFTVNTNVVQVKILTHELRKQLCKVFMFRNIAWVWEHSQQVEDNCGQEKYKE